MSIWHSVSPTNVAMTLSWICFIFLKGWEELIYQVSKQCIKWKLTLQIWRILVLSLHKFPAIQQKLEHLIFFFHLKVIYVQDEWKWANWWRFRMSIALDSISTLFHLVQEKPNNVTEWIKSPLKLTNYSQHSAKTSIHYRQSGRLAD